MSTQSRFLDALEKAVNARGHTLVVDTEWANIGTVYAVADGALSPTGARLRYDFQDGGRFSFGHPAGSIPPSGIQQVATYSTTGTASWCYDTPEKVLAVVLDALVPGGCTSDDSSDHQGDTCPVHER